MKKRLLLPTFLFLSIGLLYCKGCKKEESKPELKNVDLKQLSMYGEWEIQPSTKKRSIVFDENEAVYLKTIYGNSNLKLEEDKKGIYFFHKDDNSIYGYFLYSERGKKEWFGIWEDNLVKLRLKTKDNSSILE